MKVIVENPKELGWRRAGTFGRGAFTYDHAGNLYFCPTNKMLTTSRSGNLHHVETGCARRGQLD